MPAAPPGHSRGPSWVCGRVESRHTRGGLPLSQQPLLPQSCSFSCCVFSIAGVADGVGVCQGTGRSLLCDPECVVGRTPRLVAVSDRCATEEVTRQGPVQGVRVHAGVGGGVGAEALPEDLPLLNEVGRLGQGASRPDPQRKCCPPSGRRAPRPLGLPFVPGTKSCGRSGRRGILQKGRLEGPCEEGSWPLQAGGRPLIQASACCRHRATGRGWGWASVTPPVLRPSQRPRSLLHPRGCCDSAVTLHMRGPP